jgi:hypothetical protein
MSGGFDAPKELPSETPSSARKGYAWLFLIVACLVLITLGLQKLQLLPGSVVDTCRAYHLCGPPALKPLPPLATGWLPSGSTWESASQATLQKYRSENPDYDIAFHQGAEYNSCDSKVIKTDCEYRFEGTFSGTAKWHGLLERLGL